MFRLACIFAVLAVASAGLLHGEALVAAPVAVAPAPFVTAKSSQVIARNYNTFAAAPLAYTSPYVAAPVAAPVAPVAYTAPAYASPFGYNAPLTYAAGAPLYFK